MSNLIDGILKDIYNVGDIEYYRSLYFYEEEQRNEHFENQSNYFGE